MDGLYAEIALRMLHYEIRIDATLRWRPCLSELACPFQGPCGRRAALTKSSEQVCVQCQQATRVHQKVFRDCIEPRNNTSLTTSAFLRIEPGFCRNRKLSGRTHILMRLIRPATKACLRNLHVARPAAHAIPALTGHGWGMRNIAAPNLLLVFRVRTIFPPMSCRYGTQKLCHVCTHCCCLCFLSGGR